MFCSKCGSQIAAGASFCPNCGNPVGTQVSSLYVAPTTEPAAQQFVQPNLTGNYAPPASGLAVAALVVTFFAPLIGLILGYAARREILQSNGAKGGRGVAGAAIALGWIFTIIGVVVAIVYISYVASLATDYSY